MNHPSSSYPQLRTVLMVTHDREGFPPFPQRLEEQGFQIQWAEDANQVQNLLQERLPALIVLDLLLPRNEGLHLYCELRTHPDWQYLPLVVITDLDGTREPLRTFAKFLRGKELEPPAASLTKPVREKEFLKVVEALLPGESGPQEPPASGETVFPDPEILERAPGETLNPLPILEALGNNVRLQMLELMASHKEICVCELVQILGLSQSGISSHLTVLRRSGLVRSRKEGLWVFYAVDLEALREAFAEVESGLFRLAALAARENPETRLREKVESGRCCPGALSRLESVSNP